MNRFKVAAALLIMLPTTGCVMAVRHLAAEANRSGVQDKALKRFPIGTPVETARADLTSSGYRCLDVLGSAKAKPHVSCWPARRTQFVEKFLVGGNWRWDLFGEDAKLTRLHISSGRRGVRRVASAVESPPVVPAKAP